VSGLPAVPLEKSQAHFVESSGNFDDGEPVELRQEDRIGKTAAKK
jgi:hypothetical protein